MVGLYKDPEGDTIFDNSKSTAGGTTVMNNNLQTRTIEGLKGRVTELEAIVASTGGGFAVRKMVRYIAYNQYFIRLSSTVKLVYSFHPLQLGRPTASGLAVIKRWPAKTCRSKHMLWIEIDCGAL